ncbi:hypothetical protein CTI12_AA026200 [Artemisia annua]|uniref:Uncharacterized protein n=1 Tax=Artemisia annua TaxID=35608 RepID=A0A2U1QIH4_ARTAN|nr:hypothetical protein CTI12_AA026200 [Artemisia annua]
MKRSANKYVALEQYDENEIEEINAMRAREIVDGFISLKRLPTEEEKNKWTYDMSTYFKQRWNQLVEKGKNKDPNGMQQNDIEVNVYEEKVV